MPTLDPDQFFRRLAIVLTSGTWSAQTMAERYSQSLADRVPNAKIQHLFERVESVFSQPPRLSLLADFLREEFPEKLEEFAEKEHLLAGYPDTLAVGLPVMSSHPNLRPTAPLPELVTSGQFADWLGLEIGQLDWLADCHGHETLRPREALRHYHYRWFEKRNRTARLIEIPKHRLREIQRQILRDILNAIPLHEAAHGFCKGRSVVTHSRPHCDQQVLLRIDLRDFFPSIERPRVHALFRTMGYPESVARLLTGLCTNTTPRFVLESHERKPESSVRRYGVPHLPQGSPTSPAIANLAAFRLDCRLSGLARSFEARYTRYADDLTFSGGRKFQRRLAKFRQAALAIVLCEGFEIRHRKTHVASRSRRQQIGGLVVNAHPNVPRDEYDRLKAIIHNCICKGPASQNREGHPDFRAHLLGRIGYVAMIHPQRGKKLRHAFEQINWPSS